MTQIKAARAVTTDRIQEQLRKDIIIGKYRKGDKIVETDLAEAFEASRGSVRSALQALEGEGLIRMLPNGRKEVVGFTKKEARDMYEMRWMIENHAVKFAWENKTMNFTPLLEVLREIEQCAQEMDTEADWYDLDIRFHHFQQRLQRSGLQTGLLRNHPEQRIRIGCQIGLYRNDQQKGTHLVAAVETVDLIGEDYQKLTGPEQAVR